MESVLQNTISLTEILVTIQSEPHGGSERGLSYWGKGAVCGRKVNLDAEAKENSIMSQDIEDGPDALAIGTYYHRLHELGARGQLPSEIWDFTDSALTPTFLEALRLYRGYIGVWGNVSARYGGEIVDTEVAIPSTPEGEARVQAAYGERVTGRIDGIIDIHSPEVALANTGAVLQPGRYLLDYKSLKGHSKQHVWTYQYSLQAAAYLDIYNMENPNNPAKGMIFDIMIKNKTIRKYEDNKGGSSFATFVQYPDDTDRNVVSQLVQIGKRNINENIANPQSCFANFEPCPHFRTGRCQRF